MNNTKWREIFKAFFYDVECAEGEKVSIPYTVKNTDGFIYGDSTWSHFGAEPEDYKSIEWLKIQLTPQNKDIVLSTLRKIHLPGEVFADCVYIYGYRNDVGYI